MKIFEDYKNAKNAICRYFNCSGILGDIEMHLDKKWTDFDEEFETVAWGADKIEYEAEIWGTSRWETDEHVMFCVSNDCGGEVFLIFSKSNKKEE